MQRSMENNIERPLRQSVVHEIPYEIQKISTTSKGVDYITIHFEDGSTLDIQNKIEKINPFTELTFLETLWNIGQKCMEGDIFSHFLPAEKAMIIS